MTRVFRMGWTWILKFAVISFRDHLLPRNASMIFSILFIRSDLNHFDHLFLFIAKTKCGNPPLIIQRCVLSGTEGFFFDRGVNFVFAFYFRWSWSSRDFSDAQLTLRRKFSDICFDTHMSVSFEFVREGEGGGRFFWGSGYFNKSDIRVPKFYQLTMQCVNSQLN